MVQHRLVLVLSLTTSLVTPLNFVIVGALFIESALDDSSDSSAASPIKLFWVAAPTTAVAPVLHILFILCGAPINDPFSELVLLRDWARCFFKLANVVPVCDWSMLWVSSQSGTKQFMWFSSGLGECSCRGFVGLKIVFVSINRIFVYRNVDRACSFW